MSGGGTWERFILAERGPLQRYAAAALLSCAALALVLALNRVEGTQLSSLALASVVLSAVYGGRGPALLAAAISAVGTDYLFAEPVFRIFDSWASVLRVAIYAGLGFLVANIVGALRDAYRDLHAKQIQTERATRERENMVAIVSHDLRSPLSAILMSVGHVRRAVRNGASIVDLQNLLAGIHRAADRMTRLVDDLLDAASIESGRFRVVLARHQMLPIIEDAVETVRAAAEQKEVRIIAQPPPAAAHYAQCDRERMVQALSNLLANAVKFSPRGAPVDVALGSSGEWIDISVADRGPGIAEAHRRLVFERYWQAGDPAHKGVGLGLFIAKSIVDAHGGRIEITTASGGGANFTVRLRREAAPAP